VGTGYEDQHTADIQRGHIEYPAKATIVHGMTAISALPAPAHGPVSTSGPGPVLDVVIPVHNEEIDLEPCIRRLYTHLTGHFPYSFRVTIADNASNDGTWQIAEALAAELPDVQAVRLEQKGRGRALHTVWPASDAQVLAYMDVDLSTDLAALSPLVAPLISGHSDVAIGSRLARSARVVRGAKREFISRCYNMLLRSTLAVRFSDAQCGFKAIRADVAHELLPYVVDTGWFFDTELLVLAQRAGARIHEVPVDWVDDPDSRVDIMATALADLRGIARLIKGFSKGTIPIGQLRARPRNSLGRQLLSFGAIGIVSTIAYLVLFSLLRGGLGAQGAQGANFAALLVTAIGNTAANRRMTFGVRGSGAVRHQFEGLIVFALGLGLTSAALALVPAPNHLLEIVVLIAANLAATLSRFLLLRVWVFNPARARS
jgi:putative flippase GtrA